MTRAAFALAAAVIFLLMVLHSLTMLSVCEKQTDAPPKNDLKAALRDILRDKNVRRITVVFLLYYVSTYAATPFYGTYQIGELGLSLKYVSAIAVCGSLSRITVSRFWGRYADKNSFAVMIEKCFVFLGIARLCVVFAVPASGKVMFVLYYIFHGIALGGINSALTNLIFERLPAHRTSDALAITQACAGTAGFLTTLCISPLVTCIQNNGNSLLGVPVYAQQVLSALSLAFVVLAIVYTRKVFIKNEKI
jgi:MFS family permease